jgi:hypothetical protein
MTDILSFPIPTEVLDPENYPEFKGEKGDPGSPGAKGDTGDQGPKGDPGDVSSPDDSVQTIVKLTQDEYDALESDVIEDRLYIIVEEDEEE